MRLGRVLTEKEMAAIAQTVEVAADEGRTDDAWKALGPLLLARQSAGRCFVVLAAIVDSRCLPIDKGLEVLVEIERAHADDAQVLAAIGGAMAGARDIDDLNTAPPEHPLFATIVGKLEKLAGSVEGTDMERDVLSGLGTAARMCGRQHDDLVEHGVSTMGMWC